jgi:DNA-directed RNA polymerase III subunit RPC1
VHRTHAELRAGPEGDADFVFSTSSPYSKHIQFSVLSSREAVAIAEFEANQRDLYTPGDRRPVEHGVLDKRLGTSDKAGKCDTCGLGLADCVGHYAYIKLVLPVFHIGYFKHILSILQCICKVRSLSVPHLCTS